MGPRRTGLSWAAVLLLLLILTCPHGGGRPTPKAQVLGFPAEVALEGDDGPSWPGGVPAPRLLLPLGAPPPRRPLPPRSKKGLLPRGCFGVKLDRIGALSGMGC